MTKDLEIKRSNLQDLQRHVDEKQDKLRESEARTAALRDSITAAEAKLSQQTQDAQNRLEEQRRKAGDALAAQTEALSRNELELESQANRLVGIEKKLRKKEKSLADKETALSKRAAEIEEYKAKGETPPEELLDDWASDTVVGMVPRFGWIFGGFYASFCAFIYLVFWMIATTISGTKWWKRRQLRRRGIEQR